MSGRDFTTETSTGGGRPWTIRRAVESDATRLAPFAARVFYETFAALSDPRDMQLHLESAYAVAHVAAEIRNPRNDYFLAHAGDVLAAYLKLRHGYVPECVADRGAFELNQLYVDFAWHGRGLAADLMELALAEARRRGYRTLWLGVWEFNPRARAFYEKCGFRHVGEHPYQFGNDPQTDMVMIRAV